MRMLDWDRPYTEIHGGGRTLVEQDGLYFGPTGVEIRNPDAPPDPSAPPPAPVEFDAVTQMVAEANQPPPSDDMRRKENIALKVQMKNFGEEWQGVAHARRFLGIVD